MSGRAFTVKSILFSLIGIAVLSILPVYSYQILEFRGLSEGYLPALIVFLTVIFSLVWNGIVGRISSKLALSTKELAVIFGFMLILAWLPRAQEEMVRHLVLPRYEELTTNAEWEEAGLTTRLPDRLFPRGLDGEVIGNSTHFGMIQGGVKSDQIPYKAWVGPLLNWAPFLIVLPICLLGMTFMVHRQWTIHEQLRYPLASVAQALIKQNDRKTGGALFLSGLFWCGFVYVFGIYLIKYLHLWFPTNTPMIPMAWSLNWGQLFPSLGPSNGNFGTLSWMNFTFAIIGIAYFVPTDVSFTMGMTAPLAAVIAMQFYFVTGKPLPTANLETMRAGGFIAFAVILAYTGRTYYFPILLKAIWPAKKLKKADPGGVWAARVFLAGYIALVLIVTSMGVDWLMAWVIVTFILLIFLVITRVVCETGVGMASSWSLPGVMSGLFGPAAIGAAPLMFITFLSNTINSASSTTLPMPYMATTLKVLDDNKVKLSRFAFVSKIAMLIALIAGFAAIINISYTFGQGNLQKADRGIWSQGVRQVLTVMDFGKYEASEAAHGFGKLALLSPDGGTVSLFLCGIFAVLICYMLRFRFAKWPLHPLFFIVIGTQAAGMSWAPFLLGWSLKSLIVKIGGGRVYEKAKPLFIGFILGEFISKAMMAVTGLIYNWITGDPGPDMWTL